MCQEIPFGNYIATKDENGHWLYKAKDSVPLAKKKNPQYKEKPQFGIQYQIEGNAKAKFRKTLNTTIVNILKIFK